METDAPRILIVEPAASLAQAYVNALRREGYGIDLVDTAAACLKALATAPVDLVLLNLQLPDRPGLDLVRDLVKGDMAPRLVVLTSQGSVQLAVDVMRAGAADVLLLPVGTERLRSAVATALADQPAQAAAPARTAGAKRKAAAQQPAAARPDGQSYFGFIGGSPQMQAVYRLVDSAAPSKATVFITGESGTGKEVCAEAIHRRSPRSGGPFVAINCAAIPKDLMESEIFGHVKGAFTGATAEHAGAAIQANGGTLFLDEICEMDLSLQAKLLRFLQTGMVKKVGSEKLEPVDVRIVCATNRDPYAEVQAGRFREDLFYRLQVISIELPPLRERGEDVLLIARAFLAKFSKEEGRTFRDFGADAAKIIRDYQWPGNVRQLLNVVRNVVVLNDGEEVQPFMFPPPLNKPTMIVPPMLADPRWAAMVGPLPFPFPFAAAPPPPAPPSPPAQPVTAPPIATPPIAAPHTMAQPMAAAMPGPATQAPVAPASATPPGPVGFAGLMMPPAAPGAGIPVGAARFDQPIPAAGPAPVSNHSPPPTPAGTPEQRIRPLWLVEEETIEEAIRLCEGNITRAAALLEINPCTIYRRRQRRRARG